MAKKIGYKPVQHNPNNLSRQEIIEHVLGSTAIEIGSIPTRLQKEIKAYNFRSHSLVYLVPTPLLERSAD